MVHNLPMILTTLRLWVLMLLCLLTTVSAQAHPGHDGHKDGDANDQTHVTVGTATGNFPERTFAEYNHAVAPMSRILIPRQQRALAGPQVSFSPQRTMEA